MSTFSPILITSTPSDVIRGWIGAATRAGHGEAVVSRMAAAIDGTTGDVHGLSVDSDATRTHLVDDEIVMRLAGSVGASPLALSYRSVLRSEGGDATGYRFVLSDDLADRAEDIVDQSWDLREFADNPVAPWNHDYHSPPIGRWVDVSVVEGALRGTLIPTPVESYPLSLTVAALLEAGTLRTVSVGFRPTAVLSRASLDPEDARYSDRGGAVYVRPRLLECSVTPMPMNPRASLARSLTTSAPSTVSRSKHEDHGMPYDPSDVPRLPWA